MTLILSPEEIQAAQEQLAGQAFAQEAIAALQAHGGRLDTSFNHLCAQKIGVAVVFEPDDPRSFWHATLNTLASTLCRSKSFQQQLQDYQRSPDPAAQLPRLIDTLRGTAALPMDQAMATLLLLHLLRVDWDSFCTSPPG